MAVSNDWLEELHDGDYGRVSRDAMDFDLRIAQRDREKLEEAVRGQAVLHVMEEIAGEVFLHTYEEEVAKTMAQCAEQWGVPSEMP